MNLRRTSILLLSLALAACLGAVDIGGTLSGLPAGASVTLQNNGTDNLTLTADGSFTFPDAIADGEAYSVTVLTQPVGATCAVSAGSGTVKESTSSSITSVVVTCTSTSGSISGSVTGLGAGLTLTLANGTTELVVANTAWAFPGTVTAGTTYNVTVKTQPLGQACTVAKGSGTVVSGTPTAIAVTCGAA